LIELLHSASLIIDDIQDGSVERRGKPCTHTIHGIDSSINAANLIYYLPANRLINSLSNLELKCEISEIYMNAMVGLHIGQGLDIAVHKIEKKEDLPSTN
jgi:octaprenyl-diphosphate synthase